MATSDPTASDGSRQEPPRTLRIGIEAHVVGERPSGNGRVVVNLVRGIEAISDHRLFVYVTDPKVAAAWRRTTSRRTTVRLVRPRNPFVRVPFALPSLAVRDRLDVFVAHDTRPPVAPCPVVTLVHDVAFARHPEFFSRYQRLWMNRTIPYSCRRSAGVIAVSNFTRDEIIDLYSIPPHRITVAPNGVDPIFVGSEPQGSPVEPPFFLTMGNLQPRKNLQTLIRAYRALRTRHPLVQERLIVVGQKQYQADPILDEASDLRRDGRLLFLGYRSNEEVIGLMQRASAFAYPSVYEGFGLPPLEAMAVGAPAVVSDIPVMREVVGDAALRVPPLDVNAWSEALHRLATDAALREDLIGRGRVRAAAFTWENAALAALCAVERAAG